MLYAKSVGTGRQWVCNQRSGTGRNLPFSFGIQLVHLLVEKLSVLTPEVQKSQSAGTGRTSTLIEKRRT